MSGERGPVGPVLRATHCLFQGRVAHLTQQDDIDSILAC